MRLAAPWLILRRIRDWYCMRKLLKKVDTMGSANQPLYGAFIRESLRLPRLPLDKILPHLGKLEYLLDGAWRSGEIPHDEYERNLRRTSIRRETEMRGPESWN